MPHSLPLYGVYKLSQLPSVHSVLLWFKTLFFFLFLLAGFLGYAELLLLWIGFACWIKTPIEPKSCEMTIRPQGDWHIYAQNHSLRTYRLVSSLFLPGWGFFLLLKEKNGIKKRLVLPRRVFKSEDWLRFCQLMRLNLAR